jgi:hypothetical protein
MIIKLRILFSVILILIIAVVVKAQDTIDIMYMNVDDTINVYNCKQDSVYCMSLIPENILDLKYDFIVINFELDTIGISKEKIYNICWPSPYIDGDFQIEVNPRQIYLITGHNNPNPSFVYWVKNINIEVYSKIEKALKDSSNFKESVSYSQYVIVSYKDYIPEIEFTNDEWTNSEWLQYENDYYEKSYMNFSKIIEIFNNELSNSEKIIIPDFESFRAQYGLYILFGLGELGEQPKNTILKIDY